MSKRSQHRQAYSRTSRISGFVTHCSSQIRCVMVVELHTSLVLLHLEVLRDCQQLSCDADLDGAQHCCHTIDPLFIDSRCNTRGCLGTKATELPSLFTTPTFSTPWHHLSVSHVVLRSPATQNGMMQLMLRHASPQRHTTKQKGRCSFTARALPTGYFYCSTPTSYMCSVQCFVHSHRCGPQLSGTSAQQ